MSADCDVATGSRDIVTSRRKSILAGAHQETRDPSQPISVLLEHNSNTYLDCIAIHLPEKVSMLALEKQLELLFLIRICQIWGKFSDKLVRVNKLPVFVRLGKIKTAKNRRSRNIKFETSAAIRGY